MGTRSLIAIKVGVDNYKTVCCHRNGSPTMNGVYLHHFYNTEDKALELVCGGDIYFLEKTLDAYKLSVDGKPPVVYTWLELLKQADKFHAEYLYIFTDGQWKCLSSGLLNSADKNNPETMNERIKNFTFEENQVMAEMLR